MTVRWRPIPRYMRRLILLPVLIALLLPIAAAPAQARPMVGVGDQNFLMFQDKRFTRLHVQLTRIALPWDWYRNPSYVTFLDSWVNSARAAKVKPLIAFQRNWRKHG